MLKNLRKKKMAKFIWIILAIIVIPAFVLWGSSGTTRSKEESTYLGKIFGKKVTLLELQDAISAVRNQVIMEYGDNSAEIEKDERVKIPQNILVPQTPKESPHQHR